MITGALTSKSRRILATLCLALGAVILSSCGGTPTALPDPEIKIYLLDLSGSGDVQNQFRLIKEDLVQDLTSKSLGSPYTMQGPSLTKFYFVGTNSRALREFSLQDHQVAYDLYKKIAADNNSTRAEVYWRLLSDDYQNYITQKLDSKQALTKEDCRQDFNEILKSTWATDSGREGYSSFMCKMAEYSITHYQDLQQYIDTESKPGVQKASDVFGALSKIGSQISKFRKDFPNSQIQVTLATDGDHYVGISSPDNLSDRLKKAPDSTICAIAEEYRQKFQLTGLTNSSMLQIDSRGIAALTNGTGEYPRKLESFWQCFFPQ